MPTLTSNPIVRALVATQRSDVQEALARTGPYDLREAFTTSNVYHTLQYVRLAIIDFDALQADDHVTLEMLFDVLNRARVVWCDPDTFVADPQRWRAHALAAAGNFQSFPPLTVCITSFSGGVGKTTLTLDAAAHFSARTHLPTAVVEFPYGPSQLRPIAGIAEGNDFVGVGNVETAALPTWRNVTLVTVNYYEIGPILTPDQVRQRFERIRRAHVLTLVDSEYPHPWIDIVAPQIAKFLIVGAPRADAWSNAAALSQIMSTGKDVYKQYAIVFNMVDGWRDRLTQMGLSRALDLPRIKDPERFDGRLGNQLLRTVYPYWRAS